MARHHHQPADRHHAIDVAVMGRVDRDQSHERGAKPAYDLVAVPVTVVAGVAVVPVVVVAAAVVPVVPPTWIPPLSGTRVVIREGCGHWLGLGDGGRPQTSEPRPAPTTNVVAAERRMRFMPHWFPLVLPAQRLKHALTSRFHNDAAAAMVYRFAGRRAGPAKTLVIGGIRCATAVCPNSQYRV